MKIGDIITKLRGTLAQEGTSTKEFIKALPFILRVAHKIKKNDYNMNFIRKGKLWYIDIPDWPLDEYHLMMVAGADTLLDNISKMHENIDKINIIATPHKKEVASLDDTILLENPIKDTMGLAATYHVRGNAYGVDKIWLCPVLSIVYGGVPNYILFEVKNVKHTEIEIGHSWLNNDLANFEF